MTGKINLEVFHGKEASVNAYIFSDTKSTILVDCLRNSDEARKLAEKIKQKNTTLTHLLITHGHPDHYIGMNVIKSEFPAVEIVVTTAAVKDDIINFSTWMESVGWLDKESSLKPLSPINPSGFDYKQQISILKSNYLPLMEGALLELNSDYPAAECEHLTTIFSKDLNAFFTNDFCYHGVHPWLAIAPENIVNWKHQLEQFEKLFSESKPTIYPGHGKPGEVSVFSEQLKYINYFQETVASSTTREEAFQKMVEHYPDYEQADFLLLYSVNTFIPE